MGPKVQRLRLKGVSRGRCKEVESRKNTGKGPYYGWRHGTRDLEGVTVKRRY